MPPKSKVITFRLGEKELSRLKSLASKTGKSPGGVAREMVSEALSEEEEKAHTLTQIQREIKTLRSELSIVAEALLTVIGGTESSAESAASWVRRNLNR